jgi:hypothetical protein
MPTPPLGLFVGVVPQSEQDVTEMPGDPHHHAGRVCHDFFSF